MKLVSKKILDEATECQHQSVCVDDVPYELCEANTAIGSNFVFLKSSRGKPSCYYCFDFGHSWVCRCPVRIELFIRHNI